MAKECARLLLETKVCSKGVVLVDVARGLEHSIYRQSGIAFFSSFFLSTWPSAASHVGRVFTLSTLCSSARSVAEALALWSTRLLKPSSLEDTVSILHGEVRHHWEETREGRGSKREQGTD